VAVTRLADVVNILNKLGLASVVSSILEEIMVTCLAEAVDTLDKIGLALRTLSTLEELLVTCLVEAVHINDKIGLALLAWVLIKNVMVPKFHIKLGLCMGMGRRRWSGYMITVQEASQIFLGMVWGEVELEKDRTGSMVRGQREVL
jgi:hypothetical protein